MNVGPAGSDISIVGQSANRLFFFATTPATGRELWSTDGTLAGTTVLDLTPGPTSSSAVATTVGDRVYLTGQELAVTDGTLAGTTTFDLNPFGSSFPLRIHPIHSSGSILFQASDGVAGRELWVSNGTAAGTRMIADINPGAGDSDPENFGRLGRNVLFAAEEPLLLREPYVLDLGTVGVPLAEPIGAGCPGTNGLIPRLAGAPAPVLGGSTQLLLTSALPASIAVIAFDLQTTGLLAPCTPVVLPAITVMLITDGSGNASMTQAWPTSIALQGTAVWAQGAVLDQAGGFLGFLSLSSGLHLLLGS